MNKNFVLEPEGANDLTLNTPMLRIRWAAWAGLAAVTLLSGCASMGGSGLTHDQLMSQAAKQQAGGNNAQAISLFEKAAKADPVDATPWVDIARIHFDNNDYVKALSASEEAISRDEKNTPANSIALVSSLRLAESSLATLQKSSNLKGSMRQRANQLAQQLQATLGEGILPSDEQAKSEATASRTHHRTASHHHASSHAPATSSSASQPTAAKSGASTTPGQTGQGSDNGSSNPFQKLENLPK